MKRIHSMQGNESKNLGENLSFVRGDNRFTLGGELAKVVGGDYAMWPRIYHDRFPAMYLV